MEHSELVQLVAESLPSSSYWVFTEMPVPGGGRVDVLAIDRKLHISVAFECKVTKEDLLTDAKSGKYAKYSRSSSVVFVVPPDLEKVALEFLPSDVGVTTFLDGLMTPLRHHKNIIKMSSDEIRYLVMKNPGQIYSIEHQQINSMISGTKKMLKHSSLSPESSQEVLTNLGAIEASRSSGQAQATSIVSVSFGSKEPVSDVIDRAFSVYRNGATSLKVAADAAYTAIERIKLQDINETDYLTQS